ncbi:hypothetical protein B0H19DRAFT_1265330 [Mycena capillaripes]|nr:hypothetical protein B0H19DRAFT_1265330 [Mycena capillaripes]
MLRTSSHNTLSSFHLLIIFYKPSGVPVFRHLSTEKYAHVTFFFNGGMDEQLELQERFMIPSQKGATYGLKPARSIQAVVDKVASIVENDVRHFFGASTPMLVLCPPSSPLLRFIRHPLQFHLTIGSHVRSPFAVLTMHIARSLWAPPPNARSLSSFPTPLRTHRLRFSGPLPFSSSFFLGSPATQVITADHGNVEQMANAATGAPHTTGGYALGQARETGALCDVASLVLDMMGLLTPNGTPSMTGLTLLRARNQNFSSWSALYGWRIAQLGYAWNVSERPALRNALFKCVNTQDYTGVLSYEGLCEKGCEFGGVGENDHCKK